MTDEDEVLAANAAFYAAFANSDVKAMDSVWARRAPVACVHPGWEALVGRDRVMDKLGHETAIWSGGGRTYAVLADGRPPDFDHIVSYVKAHAK